MDRTYTRLTLVGLLLLTALCYAPVRLAPYVYEDVRIVESDVQWTFPGRGLTQWTFEQIGTTSGDSHLVNVVLHFAVGAMTFAVISLLAGQMTGLFAATAMLLHPLNSEAVNYLSARGDVLVTLFGLMAVYLTVQWIDRREIWRLALAVAAMAAAGLSKEIGLIAVPLVVLSVLVWRRGLPQSAFLGHLLLGGLGVIAGLTWWRIGAWIPALSDGFDWPTFAWLQLTAVWHLLALVVWPVGFSIDHDIVGLSGAWRYAAIVLTGITAIVLSLYVTQIVLEREWRTWRVPPIVVFGFGWVALCVAPRFVFATNEFIHEYHLYPAMVGVSALLGAGAEAWRLDAISTQQVPA